MGWGVTVSRQSVVARREDEILGFHHFAFLASLLGRVVAIKR